MDEVFPSSGLSALVWIGIWFVCFGVASPMDTVSLISVLSALALLVWMRCLLSLVCLLWVASHMDEVSHINGSSDLTWLLV